MGVFDKVREFAEHLSESDEGPAKGSPAAASGGGLGRGPGSEGQDGEVSEAGSSFDDPQAAFGGADAVPATPDATPSTRLDTGGEDKPKHEDQRSENIASVAPSENVPASERDDV
ncbi:hypothetical protein [Microlunatus antarcticus]|uniref:Uncharacterized protein n=1 Tax=Microlunatus antarcticus TaxID=53388 RepID=A0A7W5JYX3_9ACTN|nr:hypothetical protein [Microlunatus antarcticus]MBB3328860.1 hypothetical protein [Microlunatus antarcticus]